MLQAYERLSHTHDPIDGSITLDHDTRKKARIKGQTDQGESIGIFVERGHPLLVGEVLKTECGKLIEVLGQAEPVNTATATDWLTFSKVCYHLGNRHTVLQVGELWVRFKPDHVLAELTEQYGLIVDHTPAIFEPENGAYGKGGHSHGHGHSHSHSSGEKNHGHEH
ncbi:urease accessory protein UreE [Paraglaciecola sp.]|uniref:urease accessory protein UreE n=1 Tax=Paraglaciecola sp. TaxID=1920173 RepID=UPI003EF28EE1